MNSELNTLAQSHLKPTPLSWGMNASAVGAASEFSLDGACVSFHCGCLFLILVSPMILGNGWMSVGRVKIISVNTREWGGRAEQKPVSSPLVHPPSTHICRAPAGTQALLGSEDPRLLTPPESQPWLRGLAGSVLPLKVPHSFLRKNGHQL